MTYAPPADTPKPLLVLIAGPYLRLLECCDAVFRIPGESRGADLDVARAREIGLAVYTDLAELPRRLHTGASNR